MTLNTKIYFSKKREFTKVYFSKFRKKYKVYFRWGRICSTSFFYSKKFPKIFCLFFSFLHILYLEKRKLFSIKMKQNFNNF